MKPGAPEQGTSLSEAGALRMQRKERSGSGIRHKMCYFDQIKYRSVLPIRIMYYVLQNFIDQSGMSIVPMGLLIGQ